MSIQGIGSTVGTYTTPGAAASRPKGLGAFLPAGSQGGETRVSISDEAKALGMASSDEIQAKLAAIQARPGAARVEGDTEFLLAHDPLFAAIAKKPDAARTAEEHDYMQKAGGFVNTMANLSPDEKKLYNELVAQGNTEAVRGMNLLALSRMGGGEVMLPNGQTFDPQKTEITPANIRNFFSQMFSGNDDSDARSFEALASYLESKVQGETARA
jgi:hypothetical protein